MRYFEYNKNDFNADYYDQLHFLMENWENETVEFKEATGQYSTDKIGQYFSAISNEANLKKQQYGWLVLGVSEKDKRHIVGTAFKNGDTQLLEKFKHQLSRDITDGATFIDIIELFPINAEGNERRVLMLKIPAAATGIPTAWRNKYYARSGESLVALQQFKIDEIRSQERKDWSKLVIQGASIEHLDPDAIAMAREMYKEKMRKAHIAEDVDSQTDLQFLEQLKLAIDGKITNAAMILLGREDADYLFDNPPKIMWRLYGADGSDKDYEIFTIPFLSVSDKVLAKIRNLKYRYLPNQQSLFTQETEQYDIWLLREILNNSIAHANYQLGGRIYVDEFEDHIIVTNPGEFLPQRVETVLRPGYNPPFYRNQRLADGMVKLHMIDTATSGIRKVYRIQREKFFPMPDYDLSKENKVSVTIHGKVLDDKYTRLLFSNHDLDLETVFLLDKVQKHLTISKEDTRKLRKLKLVEGRYPNIFVSYEIAEAVGETADYVSNKGLDDDICMVYIEKTLERGPAKKKDIYEAVKKALPGIDEERKRRKLSTLLQRMYRQGIVDMNGNTKGAKWFLKK
ncbi:MAG: putative DNA binding domain-containing protein [Firmicutes bacterium]|nr:putative DNA binding domain-containing protein [Bacillota bacterium]